MDRFGGARRLLDGMAKPGSTSQGADLKPNPNGLKKCPTCSHGSRTRYHTGSVQYHGGDCRGEHESYRDQAAINGREAHRDVKALSDSADRQVAAVSRERGEGDYGE